MDWHAYLLSFLISHAPPGTTQYSLEVLPDCGLNKAEASCEIAPVCNDRKSMLCRAPWWAESKKAWVRFESKEAAIRRYEMIVDVMVKEARRALFCEGFLNVASGDGAECVPLSWGTGDGEHRLATLLGIGAGVMIPESYVREDVQVGRGRSRLDHSGNIDYGEGRGPGNEAGFWQPHPTSAWAFMGYAGQPKQDYLAVLVGDGREPVERAVALFYRMIAHTRSVCSGKASVWTKSYVWAWTAISMYGTGRQCDAWNGSKTAARHRLFEKFMMGVRQ